MIENAPGPAIADESSEDSTVTERDSVASRLCACGRAVPRSARRPRLSCSPACKRRRDRTLRKVERRRLWIALLKGGAYQHEEDAAVGAELEQEIQALLASLEAVGVVNRVDA